MKRIFYIFLVLILGIVVFIWYAGAFEKVNIAEQKDGPYVIAGVEHTGAYSKIPVKFQEIQDALDALNIKPERTLGIYYDDPAKVEESKLKSFAAAIIEGDNLNKLNDISGTGLKIDTIPNSNALIVDLPARSAFSYMIYPWKVYPAFHQIMEEKSYKSTISYEIYKIEEKKVKYVMQYNQ